MAGFARKGIAFEVRGRYDAGSVGAEAHRPAGVQVGIAQYHRLPGAVRTPHPDGLVVLDCDDVAVIGAYAHKALDNRLERAWRGEPTIAWLCRWFGFSKSQERLAISVQQALVVCPMQAKRQRAFLHILAGDFVEVAKILTAAPGLGWSWAEHPGHLVFPLFVDFLGGPKLPEEFGRKFGERIAHVDRNKPHLSTPDVTELIARAGVEIPSDTVRTSGLAR